MVCATAQHRGAERGKREAKGCGSKAQGRAVCRTSVVARAHRPCAQCTKRQHSSRSSRDNHDSTRSNRCTKSTRSIRSTKSTRNIRSIRNTRSRSSSFRRTAHRTSTKAHVRASDRHTGGWHVRVLWRRAGSWQGVCLCARRGLRAVHVDRVPCHCERRSFHSRFVPTARRRAAIAQHTRTRHTKQRRRSRPRCPSS